MEVSAISVNKQIGQLQPGDCFEYQGESYLKGLNQMQPEANYCIRFIDGLIRELRPDVIVRPLKGKVTFEV